MPPPKSAKRLRLENNFEYLPSKDCYRCSKCSKEFDGLKKTNFMTGAERHLSSCKPEVFKVSKQSELSFKGEALSPLLASRYQLSRCFAMTTLPINIFRSKNNKAFLKSLIQFNSIPDYKTVESDMRELEKKALLVLKGAHHYGVQLDHLKMRESENNFMRKEWQNKNFINSTFRQHSVDIIKKI